jgi:hypothetical protein
MCQNVKGILSNISSTLLETRLIIICFQVNNDVILLLCILHVALMNGLVFSEPINSRVESQTKPNSIKEPTPTLVSPSFFLISSNQYFQSVFESMASLKTIIPIVTLFVFLVAFSEGREFLVGGKENSWTSPPSSDSLILWAEKNRFIVGDFLSNISSHSSLFNYYFFIILTSMWGF